MGSHFQHPELHLAQTDARTLAAMIGAATDLTLVLGGDDVIKDLSHNLDDASSSGIPAWRGQPVEDVVRSNSRPLLRQMLRSARSGKSGSRFDVSHTLAGGHELPVQYSALRIGGDGRLMLVGRDLRLVAELQSRLLTNRQSLDENTTRQRQAEAHYRLLFETASEALVIVDAASGRIREANPRAARILDPAASGLGGKKLVGLFEKSSQADVQAMVTRVLASGTPETLAAAAAEAGPVLLAGDLFRAGDLRLILVKVSSAEHAGEVKPAADASLGNLVRNASEAVLLTDEAGRILWANESFLAIAQIPLAANAVGKSLDDFLQWSGIELDVLLANVRRHGRVQMFSGMVRSAVGQTTEVELSAISMPDGSPPGYGFVMRTRAGAEPRAGQGNSDLSRTAESLIEMVGRVPMKDLVRDTTDVIERMCIEAALKLTGNNRASAARVLGLSRQALYLKMNRFGIGDEE